MNYNVIATGSSGNATIIENTILLDCGVSFNKLKQYYCKLKLVFISHIHSDHFNKSTVRMLATERPTLRFAVGPFLVKYLIECGVSKKNIDVLKIGKKLNYKTFSLQPIYLYHDVENYGLRLFINKKKVLYATDTRTLEGIKAKNYDLYLVEAHYSDDALQQRIQDNIEHNEYVYEDRVLNTHLSLEQCNDFLLENMGEHSEAVYMHKHKEKGEMQPC